jgi:hypothetical protein
VSGYTLVAGFCARLSCGEPFTAIRQAGDPGLPRYCSQVCAKRAERGRWMDRRGRRCRRPACDGRGVPILCRGCWSAVERACKGKARLTAETRCDGRLVVYPCGICLTFHLGHRVPEASRVRVAEAGAALRAALTVVEVAGLVAAWAPMGGGWRDVG